jgi:hypothetical protein
VFEFSLSNPFWGYNAFLLEPLEVLITHSQTVTVPQVLLRELFVPTTAIRLQKMNSIAWNFGYWNNQ